MGKIQHGSNFNDAIDKAGVQWVKDEWPQSQKLASGVPNKQAVLKALIKWVERHHKEVPEKYLEHVRREEKAQKPLTSFFTKKEAPPPGAKGKEPADPQSQWKPDAGSDTW